MKQVANLFLSLARLLVRIMRQLSKLAYAILKIALVWHDKTDKDK